MYGKYKHQLLNSPPFAKDCHSYNKMLDKLEGVGKFIVDWDEDDFFSFLKSYGSISINSIRKNFSMLKNIYFSICALEKQAVREIKLKGDPTQFLDFDKLRSLTITKNQYEGIRKLLTIEVGHGEYNFRDKLLFELAWEGLTNSEIKNLKIEDVQFYSEHEVDKAKLKLKSRVVIIDDKEVITSLKKTIEQRDYYRMELNSNREYFVKLKNTPYVIKPMAMRQSNKETVANPSAMLIDALKKFDGDIPGVNFESLTIEDIRRSKIIELLKIPSITALDIKELFGKQSETDIYWLKEVALLLRKYEKKAKEQKLV